MLTISSSHLTPDMPARSALLHRVAASGGVLVRLDWPALTPALTEVRLLAPAAWSCRGCLIHADRRTSCWTAARWPF